MAVLALAIMAIVTFASPVIGVPLLIIAVVVLVTLWYRRNRSDVKQIDELRSQAEHGVPFTDRDRETLTTSESGRTH